MQKIGLNRDSQSEPTSSYLSVAESYYSQSIQGVSKVYIYAWTVSCFSRYSKSVTYIISVSQDGAVERSTQQAVSVTYKIDLVTNTCSYDNLHWNVTTFALSLFKFCTKKFK